MPRQETLNRKTDRAFFGSLGKDIAYAFSSRQYGNMSLVFGQMQDSLENRRRFLGRLGINYESLVCARQIHAANIRHVHAKDKGSGALSFDASLADTDGFITSEKNLPLAVFTADCLPIVLYDESKPAIALLHAGWRGTSAKIADKTVKLLQETFDSKPEDLRICLGPSIRPCCYEVGADFKAKFDYGVLEREGRHYLDLAAINKKQLMDSGVKAQNLFDKGECTCCRQERFFSFRREGDSSGRMISVAMLR